MDAVDAHDAGLPGETALPADYAETRTIPMPADAAAIDDVFTQLQPDTQWWLARPKGSRLVGLVVAREGMPTVAAQREALARFGVPIEGFRHPAPETGETWEERLTRLFGRLGAGDVLVVGDKRALGRDVDEETRTVAELNRRAVIVKVLDRA